MQHSYVIVSSTVPERLTRAPISQLVCLPLRWIKVSFLCKNYLKIHIQQFTLFFWFFVYSLSITQLDYSLFVSELHIISSILYSVSFSISSRTWGSHLLIAGGAYTIITLNVITIFSFHIYIHYFCIPFLTIHLHYLHSKSHHNHHSTSSLMPSVLDPHIIITDSFG